MRFHADVSRFTSEIILCIHKLPSRTSFYASFSFKGELVVLDMDPNEPGLAPGGRKGLYRLSATSYAKALQEVGRAVARIRNSPRVPQDPNDHLTPSGFGFCYVPRSESDWERRYYQLRIGW